SQSDIIHGIWDNLNENERAVVKRGRNAKSGTSPKNADVVHYRYATGFETLVGYLFLAGETERLLYILEKAYDFFCAQQ
ncbi:MAG TPA: ribonuclease III, partial [Bacillota bacterium]|nr:ribonuclease III [Bacillota bacterium]